MGAVAVRTTSPPPMRPSAPAANPARRPARQMRGLLARPAVRHRHAASLPGRPGCRRLPCLVAGLDASRRCDVVQMSGRATRRRSAQRCRLREHRSASTAQALPITVAGDDYHKARMLLASMGTCPKAAPVTAGSTSCRWACPAPSKASACSNPRIRLAHAPIEIPIRSPRRVHLATPGASASCATGPATASVIVKLQPGPRARRCPDPRDRSNLARLGSRHGARGRHHRRTRWCPALEEGQRRQFGRRRIDYQRRISEDQIIASSSSSC